MAKTIGSLAVGMSLSITDFVKNLDKVQSDMKKLDVITKSLSKTFDESVAGIMGDAVHKFAKATKIGIEDSIKFTKELHNFGAPAEAVKTVLERTSSVISRFGNKSKEASTALLDIFKAIGTSDKVALKDFQLLESMGFKAFKTLADELTKVEGKAVSVDQVMKRIASGSISGKQAFYLLSSTNQNKEPEKEIEQTKSKARVALESFVSKAKSSILGAAKSILSSVVSLITNPFTVIGGALASYGVYKIYGRAVETFAKTEEIMTRLRGLAGDVGGAKIGSVLDEIASRGRLAMDVVGGLATKFAATGMNSENTTNLLSSFARTAEVAGGNAAEIFNKLGEISLALMSTGEVNAQSFAELASMGLPVYEALAQRLSKVTGEAISAERAMAMLAGGQVSGTNALNALVGLSGNDKVKAQAEAQANTLSGIYAQLAGEIEGFFSTMGGAIAEALDLKGFNQSVIAFIQTFKTNFESTLKPAIQSVGAALAALRDILFVVFENLVGFFTRFGEADTDVGSRVANIRGMMLEFAQSIMSVLHAVVDVAVQAINNVKKIANQGSAVWAGLKGAFAGGVAGGAAGGAAGAVLGPGGGITAGLGATYGAFTGFAAAYGAARKGGDNTQGMIDREQLNQVFKDINAQIGALGSGTASEFVSNFIKGMQNSFENKKDNLEKALSIDMKGFFVNLQSGIASGEIGYTTFLSQLANGTASAIAIFKRQMELGNMSTDQFQESIGELETRALKALDIALKEGKITNEEYGASIERLYKQLDSLKPPEDIVAPFKDPKLPEWIQQLADQKSPLDTYREKLSELQDALALQLISPEKFAEGATMLADELERAVGSVEALKNPGALLAGSREAFSQVLKIQNQGSGENPQQRLARLAERANELADQQIKKQEQILAATLNNNPVVTATFGG